MILDSQSGRSVSFASTTMPTVCTARRMFSLDVSGCGSRLDDEDYPKYPPEIYLHIRATVHNIYYKYK